MKKILSLTLSLLMLVNICAVGAFMNAGAADIDITIEAEADSQVQGSSGAARNYGASTSIQVRDDGYRKSIFRFDLSGVKEEVSRAVFRVYCNTTATWEFPLVVGLSAEDDWIEGDKKGTTADEGELNYNNFPETESSFDYPFTPKKGYLEIDVTEYVLKKLTDGTVSIILSGGNIAGKDRNPAFLTRENSANKPQLVLTTSYEPAAEKIELTGAAQIITEQSGVTYADYTVCVLDQNGNELETELEWSVFEKDTETKPDGISVSDGRLRIDERSSECDVDIYVKCRDNPDVYARLSVSIIPGNSLRQITVGAEADAYVQGGSLAAYNFGIAPSLQIRDDSYRKGIIRFDVSAIPGEAKKAVLRLYCATDSTASFPMHIGITEDNSWIEGAKNNAVAGAGELCNNNMPDYTEIISYPFIPKKGYIEIDVTEPVRTAGGKISFVLTGDASGSGSSTVYFNSREAAAGQPELLVFAGYEPKPSKIEVSGEKQVISPSETQFTATVYDQANQLLNDTDVRWSVTENGEAVDGITIKNGLLTVGNITENHEVEVTAYCADDETVYGSAFVKVQNGGAYVTRTVTLTAEADSQLQSGSKSKTNYGAAKSIMVRNDGYRSGIFRFDMTDVYGIVDSAELSLYKSAVTTEELPFVIGLADRDDWIEGDKSDADAEGDEICSANAPVMTDKLAVTVGTVSGYMTFNAKSFVEKKLEQNKKVSIYLTGETNGGITNISFYAREAGINAPRLDLVMRYIPELSHIDISGEKTIIIPYSGTETASYAVSFTDQYYEEFEAEQPKWSIAGEVSGVDVDENGRVTVSNNTQSGKITLTAESEGITGELEITLLTAEEAVAEAYNALDLGDLSYVIGDIALPENGEHNSSITWSSSDEGIVAHDGTVDRPETASQTTDVELTAVISVGDAVMSKTFTASVVKKAKEVALSPERHGFIHTGGAARERLISPYQMLITNSGGRKGVLKFDISELRKYADKIERAEVMVMPWFQQALVRKTEKINSAVISDDWDPFALGEDGLYEIDGVNYNEHIKILRDNVASGKNTVYNNHKYISIDMTEQLKAKIANYSAEELTTVNEGAVSGSKFSVMLYADDVEFTSTNQYFYPLLLITMAYDSAPCDIEIEQDIYYDDKIRVPASGTEWRQYVASAIDELGNKNKDINDFKFTLAEEYPGVTVSESGRLEADAAAQAGTVTVSCRSESSGLEKSFDVEILPPIGEVERPYLLFDKETIAQFRQNVYSDTALLNKYKEYRAAASGVDLDELYSVEYIRDTAAPWVNEIGATFTAPAEAVQMELGFKTHGTGDWEFDSTSISWIGKAALEYDGADFEDGSGDTPNGWHREIISGNPELRWDTENNERGNPIKSGKRAIGLTGYAEEDSGAWVTDKIDCAGGSQYILYAAYYQKDFSPNGAAVMFARFYDEDGNFLEDYYQESGELNYRTVSRRNGLPLFNFGAAFAMEGTDNFAYGAKQYLKYHLYECKWRIENSDDSTQAVHLGRVIQGYALIYDLLRGYGYISEEEDREIRSCFYWLTDKLMDQDFYRRDNDSDLSHNYNADRTAGILSVAACFPEWSKSEEYIDHCIENIRYIFGGGGISLGENGEWLETLRYQDAVANQLFGSFEILKRVRGINMFEDENVKKFCLYPALVMTPRDAANVTYPNTAGEPQIGNSLFGEGTALLGRAAKVYQDIDPELSAELAYAWKRAGSIISAYHPIVLLNSFSSDLSEKKLNLGSRYFDNGYITFRENYGIDGRENYFVLVGSDTGYGSHQDPDRGSFSLWADSTCIAQDAGVGNYDGSSAWFRDSGAHNMVTFYESDTSDTTINGVDTTVDEVHFSEEIDYARIIADDTKNTYEYKRNVAFVKNGFSAYVIWDDIENSSRRSRFNLHTISTSSNVAGNKITSNCYNNMVLDTVVLNEDALDVEIEWGRMTGGYPTVLTDISNEPIEVAEHIKITNPKNQDFVTLLYPRKSNESGLQTETLDTGSGADAYKISKSSGEYFVVVVNNTNQTAQITLPEAMRDAKTGKSVGVSVSAASAEMLILFPETLEPAAPASIAIEGTDTISVPPYGEETGYFTADIFDNYDNTMPERNVLWSISGATEGVTVSESGAVCVTSEASAGGTVILTAVVADNEDITCSTAIALRENTELAGVSILGPKSVNAPSVTSYSAEFTDKYGREIEGCRAVWSLQSIIDGVTLDADGTLKVASGVPDGTQIELAASYTADLTINSRLVVTVGEAVLTSAVINGADAAGIPGSVQYTVTGKDQNGADCSLENIPVSFSIAEPAEGVSITEDGILTVTENAQPDGKVVIEAVVGESIKAVKEIMLKDSVPAKLVIDGKTSINIPSKGILSETYTADVYDQKGRLMSGEKAELSIASAQGVSFSGNTLSITQYASAQKLTITAVCGDITGKLEIELKAVSGASGGSGGDTGGGVGSGSYINGSSVPMPVNTVSGFADLDGYGWAKEAIEYLHERGMISGISETEFAPGVDITRAEFVTMLVNTLGLEEAKPIREFDDVGDGDWYFKAVSAAGGLGIVAGTDNNKFEPQRNITRQEMAAIVYRTLGVIGKIDEADKDSEAFADDADISGWAADAVRYMRASGIITGVGDNYFKPLDNAVRAQAAVIMYNIVLR